MSNYKKFDPSIIRARIKEGAYQSLVGANRAIGKTQGLSDEERLSLKKVAAKHFGADAPVAAAAPKAKKVAKKAGKKASKKTAKKASKRAPKTARGSKAAPAPSTEAEPAPVLADDAIPVVKKTRAKRGSKATAHASQQLELPLTASGVGNQLSVQGSSSEELSGPVATARLMGSVIGSCDQMVKAINMTNSLLPKDVAEAGNSAAVKVMTRAVSVLDNEVVGPLHKDAGVTTKAATPPKQRTPPKRVAAAKVEQPLEDTSEETAEDDVAHITPESDLTEDEQDLLNVARDVQPTALAAAGLNRVPKGLGGSES